MKKEKKSKSVKQQAGLGVRTEGQGEEAEKTRDQRGRQGPVTWRDVCPTSDPMTAKGRKQV